MDFHDLAARLERLNLAASRGFGAASFNDLVAILGIVFGGSFLLFSYRHYAYFAGITGFLLGGWLGPLIREQYMPASRLSPLVFMGVAAIIGACIAVFYRRFMGILLGGVCILIMTYVFAPDVLQKSPNQNASFGLIFLMGGGLGALFPKFFYVFDTSLIGSTFCAWGVSTAFGPRLAGMLPAEWGAVVNLLVFVPCLCFGILYQMMTTADESGPLGSNNRQIVIQTR